MKTKYKLISIILCVMVLCIYAIAGSYNIMDKEINKVYKVYLDGSFIGTISDEKALYSLIDEKQKDAPELAHIRRLAKEKQVEIQYYPMEHYKTCGIIKKMADA